MKTLSSIVVILIAVVVLYLVYRYLFIPKEKELIIPTPRPMASNVVLPTVTPTSTVTSMCDKLPSMLNYIDELYKVTQVHYNDMVKGSAITKGGLITDPVLLSQMFQSAKYTYNNEIIKYNSIINEFKCSADVIAPVNFGAVS